MTRILIVGGGCRGRALASELGREGHALRVTSRSVARRGAIEAVGAECWLGTPERLDTLCGALENVTLACWLLGSASVSAKALRLLHGPRLEAFVRLLIDTTVRGFIYEAPVAALPAGRAAELAAEGERIVRGLAERNAIPRAVIRVDPREGERWLQAARAAVGGLLDG
jgi:hypothetical protein